MAAQEQEVEPGGSVGFERVVAFSDGVFAIAITLLVLALGVPELPESRAAEELPQALRDLGPQVLSYFIGFAVIGAFWRGHHAFTGALRQFDATLMTLNLALLAFISLMPFTTGVFGRYGDVEIAIILYAANVVAASALDTAMLWVALRRGLLTRTPDDPRWALIANAWPGVVFLVSIPVALVDPGSAKYLWLALLLGPAIGRRARRTPVAPAGG
jgi:uncharacterized membrane protein